MFLVLLPIPISNPHPLPNFGGISHIAPPDMNSYIEKYEFIYPETYVFIHLYEFISPRDLSFHAYEFIYVPDDIKIGD